MKTLLRLTPVLALAAVIAGCEGPCSKLAPLTAPALQSGSANFSVVAAVGTSISTGYQSGGVVDRHQIYAFPALFAQQVGMTVQMDGKGSFSQPTVGGNGSPALLRLVSPSPPVIAPYPAAGSPTNLTWPRAYNDMAVPGSLLFDYADAGLTNYGGSAFLLVTRGLGMIQNQMLSLNPTFISFEFGSNEVLGPATAGSGFAPLTTNGATWNFVAGPTNYDSRLTAALAAIHSTRPTAKLSLCNVPDVRSIPFFTTFPPITRVATTGAASPLYGWVTRDVDSLIHTGPNPGDTAHVNYRLMMVRTLGPTDLVTLTAQTALATGKGFQAGAYNYVRGTVATSLGAPLDSFYILDAIEQQRIATNTAAMNASVAALAAANSWVALVDINGLLTRLASGGYTVRGTRYTTEFVRGGLFSLDGVHPSDIGHGILANEMIAAVNARFGSAIRPIDLTTVATSSASVAGRAGGDETLRGLGIEGLSERLAALYRR